jgi:GNAT superfamily N-acetyltransferase
MNASTSPLPTGPDTSVVTADPADLETLSQVIADAFHDLPQSQWLIPDTAARREIFPHYFQLYVEHALADGVVHTTPGRTAVALWVPGGPDAPGPPAGYGDRLAEVTGRWAYRCRAFDATLDKHAPTFPHHHLAILAVRPDLQNQGLGSALLHAHYHTLDHETHLPAYLEASTPRTRDLYHRHGYRGETPFYLPDGGPPMWPMVREPTGQGTAPSHTKQPGPLPRRRRLRPPGAAL